MTTFEAARDRAEFCLTYGKADPRDIGPDALLGPKIPDAFNPGGFSSGEWYGGDTVADDADEETWLAHFAQMAVNEAIHEALEWFKVDGRPWLDPHGEAEPEIYRATRQLCESLAGLRAESVRRKALDALESGGEGDPK